MEEGKDEFGIGLIQEGELEVEFVKTATQVCVLLIRTQFRQTLSQALKFYR